MHVNTYTIPKPPQHLLDQCIEVILPSMPTSPYYEMKRWCRENETSYVWCELIDTSDVDYEYDHMVAFYFIRPEDAVMFTLKFK